MTTITEAVNIAKSRKADYWLHQVNRDLPYGDLDQMVAATLKEGAKVTQVSSDRFLVNNSAWVKIHGCVTPL